MTKGLEERKIEALESIALSLEKLLNDQIARNKYEWEKTHEYIANAEKQIAFMEEVDRTLWHPHE